MRYKDTRRRIPSGSDRDKTGPTNKQYKWANPFYAYGTKRRIALKKKLKEMEKALKEMKKAEKEKTNEKSKV